MKIVNQTARILKTTGDPITGLKMIEGAGRTCYASRQKITEDSYKAFIQNCIKREHESPLEFCDMIFEIETSRAVLAELTRHRLASFCVESQRYIQEAKTGDITYIQPTWYIEKEEKPDTHEIWEASLIWKSAIEFSETMYKRLIDKGCKPEQAREVLPNSTACRLVMKANLREWRHIFKLRTSMAAYPQMRELMTMMLKEAHEKYPIIFDDIYEEAMKNE